MRFSLCSVLIVSLCFCAIIAAEGVSSPPTYGYLPSIKELAEQGNTESNHFPAVTEDGFVLWMFRLGNSSGLPILIQHGLFNAADLWVNRGPTIDLAFLLLQNGYDVYLGSQRGSAYALHHLKYKRSDPKFWDWSFHESGYYDLPAMIDKILKIRSDVKDIIYIGYSLGTTVFLTMGSARPEYNRKIRVALLLAPVAYAPIMPELRVHSSLKQAIINSKTFAMLLKSKNLLEIFPRSQPVVKMTQTFCSSGSQMSQICLDNLGKYLGEHRSNLPLKTFGYHLSFTPAGSSMKTLHHLGQVYNTTNFQWFDYGPKLNMKMYNQTAPPQYRLDRVSCPVALLWGRNDYLISEQSVKRLAASLPNLLLEAPIDDPLFTHADVIFGLNAPQVLYQPILKLLHEYISPPR